MNALCVICWVQKRNVRFLVGAEARCALPVFPLSVVPFSDGALSAGLAPVAVVTDERKTVERETHNAQFGRRYLGP